MFPCLEGPFTVHLSETPTQPKKVSLEVRWDKDFVNVEKKKKILILKVPLHVWSFDDSTLEYPVKVPRPLKSPLTSFLYFEIFYYG